MNKEPNFILFKKLLIFGAKGSGKSTLTSILEYNYFSEEDPSKSGNT